MEGPSAKGTIFVVYEPFRFITSDHADSSGNLSIVYKSSTIRTLTGGFVTAVPNSPYRRSIRQRAATLQ